MVSFKAATLYSDDHRNQVGWPVTAQLDAGSDNCATLILRVRDAMRSIEPGEILEVVAYDPTAQLDLRAWCRMTGNTWLETRSYEGYTTNYLEKKKGD